MPFSISRREFLKLTALLPVHELCWPNAQDLVDNLESHTYPNVLFLVFDTLSAKHMSLHGYHRDTTPNMARHAERATVFHSCYSGGSFTTPGTSSLLTGTYPWSHRAFNIRGLFDDSYVGKSLFAAVPPDLYRVAYSHNPLVMSLLYQVQDSLDYFKKTRELCLVDDSYSDRLFEGDYNLSMWSEFPYMLQHEVVPTSLLFSLLHRMLRSLRNWEWGDTYGQMFPRGMPNLQNVFYIPEHATDWLLNQVEVFPRPFLCYFHLLPPHGPYNPRQEFIDRFSDRWRPTRKPAHHFSQGHSDEFLELNRRHYDEYLAYADSEFGRLMDGLEAAGVLEDSIVVFTSDHGEMFERGILEHITPVLYEPICRVPLLVWRPGQVKRLDVHTPVSGVDILPTLLHLLGVEQPGGLEGRLLPGLGGDVDDDRSVYVVEAKNNQKYGPITEATLALRKGPYKLIHYRGYPGIEPFHELYDLENDPEELEDLALIRPGIAADLADELDQQLRRANKPFLD